MNTLEYLCESCLVRLLIATLEDRKKKIKTWIVSIEEWIEQLDIEDIKVNYFITWDNKRYLSLIPNRVRVYYDDLVLIANILCRSCWKHR